ncbi:Uncharacterised protein [Shigella sonnei]|nr:Uncharacterised protein [Shigella sonnei]
MLQRKTLRKLTWLTFMPLFKYYVVYSWGYCLFIKYGHFNRCPYEQSMILAGR